jgi:uncharacterized protein YqhQ
MSATAGPAEADAEPIAQPTGLMAPRDLPVGGQAVLEGVMMRGVSSWAVAVRLPSEQEGVLGEIQIHHEPLRSVLRRHRSLRLPLVRGLIALGESMVLGFRALGISVSAQVPPEEQEGEEEPEPGQLSGLVWFATIAIALVFSIGLFFIVPVTITNLLKHQLGSSVLFWIVEGAIRTAIFLGYLTLVSRQRDLRRVFEYHGAEHKTISCLEAGVPLEPVNAQRFSRLHPRCGTSFLLVVMIVSIFVFAPVGVHAWWVLVLTRIAGVPVVTGISFELIKLAGKYRGHAWVRGVMWPGLQLQRLTTREPDLDQLAVAIAAMQAVLADEDPRAQAADLVGLEVVA